MGQVVLTKERIKQIPSRLGFDKREVETFCGRQRQNNPQHQAIECTENEEETLNDEKQILVTNDNERQGNTKLTPVDL